MGRPRSDQWGWLPRYCYPDRGRIIYKRGKDRAVRLCSESEASYHLVVQRLAEHLGSQPDDTTVRWLCTQYLESPAFAKLAPATRRGYQIHHNTLVNFVGKAGRLLGDAPFAQITPGLLRKYLDKRAEQRAPKSGNREVKGYLSAVYAWALERDMLPRGTVNPCHGVQRNTETPRRRYVEDWELRYAIERATPAYLPIVMALCYLLAARITEVLRLQRGDLTPEGVRVRRLKGSNTNIIEWSPLLEAAVNQALGLPSRIGSVYLLHDSAGQPITYSAVRNAWDDLMAYCATDSAADGLDAWQPFTRHDLKKKGTSDHKDGRNAGHKTEAMRNLYRLREDIIEPVR